mmetsp:Transcript_55562/g.178255  ORF Transcript_55562/g.178255 Transcript_55562/m.178255 type:complete len:185 (+) Transcript_55562:73-627(+)
MKQVPMNLVAIIMWSCAATTSASTPDMMTIGNTTVMVSTNATGNVSTGQKFQTTSKLKIAFENFAIESADITGLSYSHDNASNIMMEMFVNKPLPSENRSAFADLVKEKANDALTQTGVCSESCVTSVTVTIIQEEVPVPATTTAEAISTTEAEQADFASTVGKSWFAALLVSAVMLQNKARLV